MESVSIYRLRRDRVRSAGVATAGVTASTTRLHHRDPVHRGPFAAFLQPQERHRPAHGRPLVPATGRYKLITGAYGIQITYIA